MNWETYISIGDSITKGARTYLSYPEKSACILKKQLNKQWDLINISENGFTTIDMLKYIDKHYRDLSNKQAGITTILLGTNDIKNKTELSDFSICYELLVCKAKLFTQKNNVLLIEIPNFPKGIMYPYNFEMNTQVDIYNKRIKEIAAENQLNTLKFQLDENDFFDGVHLNDSGVSKCSHQLTSYILFQKGISSKSIVEKAFN